MVQHFEDAADAVRWHRFQLVTWAVQNVILGIRLKVRWEDDHNGAA